MEEESSESEAISPQDEDWFNMEEDREADDDHGGEDADRDMDGEEGEGEQFDISLAASHSYMGRELVEVPGRAVLEPGWSGSVPGRCHSGAVFPGETVPMLLTEDADAALLLRAMQRDKLFVLLSPDETGAYVSEYGVICEVFEASWSGSGPDAAIRRPDALSFLARATQRCRLADRPRHRTPIYLHDRIQVVSVVVLPDVWRCDVVGGAGLPSMLRLVRPRRQHQQYCTRSQARRLSVSGGVWPLWLYDVWDHRRLTDRITAYWADLAVETVPSEPVRLSFWTASNLSLTARERLDLLAEDSALLRLYKEVQLIERESSLCCVSCGGEVSLREHIIAMSTDGVHAHYTNIGGFMHDIVTVSVARNVVPSGAPSEEFSWFPGYSWNIVLCAGCRRHVGWRFDACRRNLRPSRFFALCRNYVQPHSAPSPSAPTAAPPSAGGDGGRGAGRGRDTDGRHTQVTGHTSNWLFDWFLETISNC